MTAAVAMEDFYKNGEGLKGALSPFLSGGGK
jgi:hypothetical protein